MNFVRKLFIGYGVLEEDYAYCGLHNGEEYVVDCIRLKAMIATTTFSQEMPISYQSTLSY
ncbi:MAG: hypothetical protein IJX51_03430 [Clostridia bacterium]|nr:hypothetical protein [Clostridia bacterium]